MGTCPDCLGKKIIDCPECHGTGKKFDLLQTFTCSRCKGRGYIICPRCDGKGYI